MGLVIESKSKGEPKSDTPNQLPINQPAAAVEIPPTKRIFKRLRMDSPLIFKRPRAEISEMTTP